MTAGAERAIARIDLGAIASNCARLAAQLSGGTELCAVVKADGYGHGAAAAARAALDGGASRLAVATAGEATELRLAGIDAPLLVMGALTPGDARATANANADAVAWEPEFVPLLAASGVRRLHVKLDTGMGRLGAAEVERALATIARIDADPGLELAGLMTHLATADEPGDSHFPHQLGRFGDFLARAGRAGVVAHAANSAATLRDPSSHFGMVRCGIAIYGLDPFQSDPHSHGLEPALELRSYVAAVKPLSPGDSVGYGRRFVADRDTWVGILPIGYGDGWRRSLTNNSDILVGGRRRPLVGTVSMDNIAVDLGPDTEVRPFDAAILIGRQGGERILCEEVAQRLGTINYEVTCGLSPRVRREHA